LQGQGKVLDPKAEDAPAGVLAFTDGESNEIAAPAGPDLQATVTSRHFRGFYKITSELPPDSVQSHRRKTHHSNLEWYRWCGNENLVIDIVGFGSHSIATPSIFVRFLVRYPCIGFNRTGAISSMQRFICSCSGHYICDYSCNPVKIPGFELQARGLKHNVKIKLPLFGNKSTSACESIFHSGNRARKISSPGRTGNSSA